jgi:glycosyltransferase involved in cell wall biosynthesis
VTAMRAAIVIPTYNHARYLPAALDSALAQTRRADVIVVDDGSTDGTRAIVSERYPTVTYIRQDNRGVAAARNAGLAVTAADAPVFLDADDTLTPDCVERRLAVLEPRADLGWVFSDLFTMDAEGHTTGLCSERFRYGERVLRGNLFGELLLGNFIPVHAVMVRRSVIDAVGIFDETFIGSTEDYELLLRVARRFPAEYLDVPLGAYRMLAHGRNADRVAMARAGLRIATMLEERFPADVRACGPAWARRKADLCLQAALAPSAALGRRARLGWVLRAIRVRPGQRHAYRALVRVLTGQAGIRPGAEHG